MNSIHITLKWYNHIGQDKSYFKVQAMFINVRSLYICCKKNVILRLTTKCQTLHGFGNCVFDEYVCILLVPNWYLSCNPPSSQTCALLLLCRQFLWSRSCFISSPASFMIKIVFSLWINKFVQTPSDIFIPNYMVTTTAMNYQWYKQWEKICLESIKSCI